MSKGKNEKGTAKTSFNGSISAAHNLDDLALRWKLRREELADLLKNVVWPLQKQIGQLEDQITQINQAQQDNKPVPYSKIKGSPKLAQALTWLTAYPDMQGLSLRKAAEQAGVTPSTMQRAMAELDIKSRYESSASAKLRRTNS